MKKITTIFSLILAMTLWSGLTASGQAHKADDIVGTWLNEEATAKVEIYKENGKYFGKLVWLKVTTDKVTGKPRTDIENPDEKLRSVPLIGLVNIKNFSFNGTDEWSGGTIYDSHNGKTYKCYIRFESANKMKLRGYVGISLLGRTTYWTRTVPPQK